MYDAFDVCGRECHNGADGGAEGRRTSCALSDAAAWMPEEHASRQAAASMRLGLFTQSHELNMSDDSKVLVYHILAYHAL